MSSNSDERTNEKKIFTLLVYIVLCLELLERLFVLPGLSKVSPIVVIALSVKRLTCPLCYTAQPTVDDGLQRSRYK